jgi:hypothetical protein
MSTNLLQEDDICRPEREASPTMTTPIVVENPLHLQPVDRDPFCGPRLTPALPWPAPKRRPLDA